MSISRFEFCGYITDSFFSDELATLLVALFLDGDL